MKIHPMGAQLLRVAGQTGRQIWWS